MLTLFAEHIINMNIQNIIELSHLLNIHIMNINGQNNYITNY